MRKSKEELIDICFDLKVMLQLGSYTLHDYDDGAFADFEVKSINRPKQLNKLLEKFDYAILHSEVWVVIRVYENFNEY